MKRSELLDIIADTIENYNPEGCNLYNTLLDVLLNALDIKLEESLRDSEELR